MKQQYKSREKSVSKSNLLDMKSFIKVPFRGRRSSSLSRSRGVILLFFLLTSCQYLFNDVDNSYLNIDTDQEKIDMMNGVYSRLKVIHDENYFALLCRSDDVKIFSSYNYNGEYAGCTGGVSEPDYEETIGNVYLNLYKAIVNINRLLRSISVQEESTLAGELYFLRSYCYFKLTRFFGCVPLVLDIDVNYKLEKPGFKDVYGQIEEDMLNAIDLLPDTYTNARIPNETPHKGTAKAMLAEIYLSMAGYPLYDKSKYHEAAALAGEVIENEKYYSFKLLSDFANLWDEQNTRNSENIFGLFCSSESTETINNLISNSGGGGSSREMENYWVAHTRYRPSFNFFLNFPNNYRKCNTVLTGTYAPVSYMGGDTTVRSTTFLPFDIINDPCNYIYRVGCLKWNSCINKINDNEIDSRKTQNTIYLLRYAQTLLTYAEAKARAGELDNSAFEAVNRVRRRANYNDINSSSGYDLPLTLTKEQFIDSVVWERAWELTMEPDGRWFDVIRLQLREQLENNSHEYDMTLVTPDEYLTDEWYFFQIPQHDQWLNPNFEE